MLACREGEIETMTLLVVSGAKVDASDKVRVWNVLCNLCYVVRLERVMILHVNVYVCVYMCAHTHMCVCMYVCVCVRVYV